MKIFCDIDGTICSQESDYSNANPIPEKIKIMNDLYDKGHTVIYWTARGTETEINWRDITEKQFQEWGIKYHELRFGKPAYDVLIDDRAIKSVYEMLLM